jgi:uncharacterized secreted protein with C-terminal beta-propeller domain
MQTINLQIEESFYPQLKAMIKSFVDEKKIKILKKEYAFSDNITLSSVQEVQERIYASEKEEGLNKKAYEKEMEHFFKKEFGIAK